MDTQEKTPTDYRARARAVFWFWILVGTALAFGADVARREGLYVVMGMALFLIVLCVLLAFFGSFVNLEKAEK